MKSQFRSNLWVNSGTYFIVLMLFYYWQSGVFSLDKNTKILIDFQDDKVIFDSRTLRYNGRIGVTKLIIKWNDYQNECSGHIQYNINGQPKATKDILSFNYSHRDRFAFSNSLKHYYYLSFTKTAGLRSLEMNLESCKRFIQVNAEEKIEFKLCPLFKDQKLDIKNCMLEIKYFFNAFIVL